MISLSSGDFFSSGHGVWLKSNRPTGVLFITANCPHCKKFLTILAGMTGSISSKIGVVDVSRDRNMIRVFNSSQEPLKRVPRFMLYIVVGGKRRCITYRGPINDSAIYSFISDNERTSSGMGSSATGINKIPDSPVRKDPPPEYYRPSEDNPRIRPTQRRDISYRDQQQQSNKTPTSDNEVGGMKDPRSRLVGMPTPYNSPWK